MGLPQSGGGQGAAEGGRGLGAAGQEEDRSAIRRQALGHRVAGTAVGGDEFPVLPGAADRRREQLNAGDAGQDAAGDAAGPQHGQQPGSPGIKSGVAAVQQGCVSLRMLRKAGQDLFRLVQRLPVFGAAVRQVLQQPPGA